MRSPEKKSFEWPAWARSNFTLGMLTVVLWLASAAFSFYASIEFQQMVLRRIAAGSTANRLGFHVVRQWSTIFTIGIWLAFVIITEEVHFKNLRKPISWQVFKWSYLGWGLVLLLAFIL